MLLCDSTEEKYKKHKERFLPLYSFVRNERYADAGDISVI